MTGRRHERGIALAVVLWGIAALSLIATAMLASSVNAVRIGRNAWTQLQVQTAADSGVQGAILSLFDPKPEKQPPPDGTAQHIFVNGIAVTLTIQDEAGRIDLNYASRNTLRDLFKSQGADDADALADHVVDWRSPGSTKSLKGATADDYSNAGYGYRPRGSPFQSIDELRLVMGMTADLYKRVEPALTVYSHSPNFDMRVAPKQVLEIIPGMDEQKAEEEVAARAGDIKLADTSPVVASFASAPILNGHALSITASAQRGQTRFSRRAVVLISGDPARPYWILDWR
jgi:general secretion pathway protein K